jgi:hypothetical protein
MSEPSPAGRPDSGVATERQQQMTTVWERTGGFLGLFYSSFPVMVFVLVNSVAGLMAGIWSAVGTAVAFIVLRAVRKEPLRPAVSGFVGIAIASFIAYRTGSARGFFLVDIWWSLACCGVLTLSILVRWPLAGVAWSLLNRVPMAWKQDGPSRLGYDIATAALAAVFAARFVVQRWLYEENYTGWLAVAKITMGYPLTAFALIVVVWAVRRSDARLKNPDHDPSETTEQRVALAGGARSTRAAEDARPGPPRVTPQRRWAGCPAR